MIKRVFVEKAVKPQPFRIPALSRDWHTGACLYYLLLASYV